MENGRAAQHLTQKGEKLSIRFQACFVDVVIISTNFCVVFLFCEYIATHSQQFYSIRSHDRWRQSIRIKIYTNKKTKKMKWSCYLPTVAIEKGNRKGKERKRHCKGSGWLWILRKLMSWKLNTPDALMSWSNKDTRCYWKEKKITQNFVSSSI